MEQFFEYIKMAVDNIWTNKGRSFLTMLGIIIGITSVVTIVSIGNGLKDDVMEAANAQGNTVVVQTNTEEVTDTEVITGDDIAFLKSSLDSSVKAVYANISFSGKAVTVLNKRFVVFEIDSIKDNRELFPVVTIIIMEAFINKMRRLKGVRKVLICEEAWKALSSANMAEYMKYLYKTVRKYFGEAVVVTQEVDDIISSPIVKETIIKIGRAHV